MRNIRTNVLSQIEDNVQNLMTFMTEFRPRLVTVERAVRNRSTSAVSVVFTKRTVSVL